MLRAAALALCLSLLGGCSSVSIVATPIETPARPSKRLLLVVARGDLRTAYARELSESLEEQLRPLGVQVRRELQDRLDLDDEDLLQVARDFAPDGVLAVLPLNLQPVGRDSARMKCSVGLYVPTDAGQTAPRQMRRVWRAHVDNDGGMLDGQIDGRMARSAALIVRELRAGGYLP